MKHRKEKKSILNFPGAKNLKNTLDALELDCDILVPAALEKQIDRLNAPRIKAKIIGEGANGPTGSDAEDILQKKKVMVIPDMYLNAGGVTVSYFEWLKNLQHVRMGRMDKRFTQTSYSQIIATIEKMTGKSLNALEKSKLSMGADEIDLVNSGLEDTMIEAYHQIAEIRAQRKGITLRTAAFINAIDKIAKSYLELGIFP
jgi:glutamate dehydrogenase (NAD(P)+)